MVARGVRGGARLDNALLVGCLVLATLAVLMPRRFRDSAAQALRGSVLAPLVEIERRATGARAAIVSRDDLLDQRGRVAMDALQLRAVTDENLTLRRLMGLSARLTDGFVVAELMPQRGVNDDFTLTLSVGAAAGVEEYAPVVTADGLLGMVERVDSRMAFAITWAHPSFAVSAMSADEKAYGIVQPHLGSGAERLLLELKGVPFRTQLDSGTLVVSSGLGATYPRGIPVGVVLGELATSEKWARTYLLLPAVLPASIGPVLVLKSDRAARGVNQIWTNITSADSAARAMAAAGDSMASALDELAARNRTLETSPRDTGVADMGQRAPGTAVVPRADSLRADSVRRARADAQRRRLPPASAPVPRTGPPPIMERR